VRAAKAPQFIMVRTDVAGTHTTAVHAASGGATMPEEEMSKREIAGARRMKMPLFHWLKMPLFHWLYNPIHYVFSPLPTYNIIITLCPSERIRNAL